MTELILRWENFPQKVSFEMELKEKKNNNNTVFQKLDMKGEMLQNQLCQ